MRFVETDHVICFNESNGLFGTRLRYVIALYFIFSETTMQRRCVEMAVRRRCCSIVIYIIVIYDGFTTKYSVIISVL